MFRACHVWKSEKFHQLNPRPVFYIFGTDLLGKRSYAFDGKSEMGELAGGGQWTTGHRPSNMFDEHKYNEYGGWMSSHGYVWDYGRSTLR